MSKIFISGGSSGLGLRLTVDLIKETHSVFATYHDHPAPLNYLKKRFKTLHPIPLDLESPSLSPNSPDTLDSAILCAGTIRNQLMLKETSADFTHHLETNLTGTMKLCQILYPRLCKGTNAHLIVVCSRSAYEGNIGQAAYSASRAGLVGLAKTLAQEWATSGIKVNIIFPGFMKSRQTLAMPSSIVASYEKNNLLGHINTLTEISRFIRFLITTQNISGQIFSLDSRVNTN